VAPSTPRARAAAPDASAASPPPAPPATPASARPSAESLFAGGSPALVALRELIAWPVLHADLAASLGVRWPRGLLLHGPPGCGKTLLVRAVAAECGAEVRVLTAGDVFGSFAGESERRLRDAFAGARAVAAAGTPCVLFLDELDALCPRRSGGHEHEARVTAQLLVLMVRFVCLRRRCRCCILLALHNSPPRAHPTPPPCSPGWCRA
jgi:SpoVK/Ycf46/Vps4 family AAA+-type ATPase